MAINFPDSPTNGQVATVGGKNYTYNSTKNTWTPTQVTEADLSTVGSTTVVATHDLLPSSPSAGDMALVSSVNKMYVYFLSGWWLMSSLQNASPSGITGNAALYDLAADGTPTTVTLSSSDPEGFPIVWSHSVISGSLGGTTVTNVNNVFTITPSTDAADAGTFTLRFAASDGQGGESGSQSQFTLDFVFTVANSRYTTLLATAVDTSDNNNITDASSNNHSITVNGDTTSGTFSPYRSGGYSTYFDGNGDQLKYENNDYNWGIDNFTIEAWAYLEESGSTRIIFSQRDENGPMIRVNDTGVVRYFYGGGNNQRTSTVQFPINQWNHVALVRSGTGADQTKVYLNGAEILSFQETANFSATTARIRIGSYQSAGSEVWKGYITDVRAVKSAVYTAEFTNALPTERLGVIANTSLLTCHLPYLVDDSTHNISPIVTGNPSIKPFSPYDYNEYSATNHGGSINFDGTGDYLTIPDHSSLNFASNDWTIECWIYPRTNVGDCGIWHQSASGIDWFSIYLDGSFNPKFVLRNYNSSQWDGAAASNTAPQNTWTHLALVRQFGTGVYLYANGKLVASDTTNASVAMEDKTHDHVIGHERYVGNGQDFDGLISDFKIDIGTAHYTAEFTPPTAPLSSTAADLHIKGTDASIIDKSQGSNLKLYGTTTGSTDQVRSSAWANTKTMKFDGNSDYLTFPHRKELNFASNDWTIECWIYPKTNVGFCGIWHQSASGTDWYSIYLNGSFNPKFVFYNSSNGVEWAGTAASNTAPQNTWTHLALVRKFGTGVYLFAGGTLVASDTDDASVAMLDKTYDHVIGYERFVGNGTYFDGYIQDFRITNGLALYIDSQNPTTNFTPPTASLEG